MLNYKRENIIYLQKNVSVSGNRFTDHMLRLAESGEVPQNGEWSKPKVDLAPQRAWFVLFYGSF